MRQFTGDLIQMCKAGEFDVLIHGCNCFCTMGAGFAKQVKKHFPDAYLADLETVAGDRNKLGTYSSAQWNDLIIVNAYTQFMYGRSPRQTDYKALHAVFRKIKKDFTGLRIAYPKIGCGLGGAKWEIVREIINERLEGEHHTVVILEDKYDT